ncbi:MAG: DNA polymerase III subunit delta, partial [Thiohalomonadales bacterium]
MKSSPLAIQNQLQKSLASVYLVTGDEPLQHMETCDLIRHAAKQRGYTDREIFHIDKNFDWSELFMSTSTMSLFSHLRFIELRIGNGKLGEKGNKALFALLSELPQDTIILITSSKLDAAVQRTKWFKCLDKSGVSIQIWPIEARQLAAWIQQRMQKIGLLASRDAIQILAERGEGNLLAIAQEIEKLRLLGVAGDISVDDVLSSVSDSARFDIYTFVDTCLGGDIRRVVRMLEGLQSEGVEAILVLWVMSREIRNMALMAKQTSNGLPLDQILSKNRVWPKRKALVGA